MPSQDPVEKAIDRAGAEVAGRLIIGWLGFASNQAQKKELKRLEEQRRLKLPEALESSQQNPIVYTAGDSRQRQEAGRRQRQGDEAEEISFADQFALAVNVLAGVVFFGMWLFGHSLSAAIVIALAMVAGGYTVKRRLKARGRTKPKRTLRDGKSLKKSAAASKSTNHRTFLIKLPQQTEWHAVRAGEFMGTLLARFTGLAFQIEATHDDIHWQVVDLRCNAEPGDVKTVIQSYYPQAEVTWTDDVVVESDPLFWRYVMHFQHIIDFFQPMKRAEDLKQSDPLTALTQEMATLQPGERIIYSLYVADYARFAHEQVLNFLTWKVPKNPLYYLTKDGMYQGMAEAGLPPELTPLYSDADTNLFLRKFMSRMYLCFLMVQVDAPTRERVLALSHSDGYVEQFDNAPYNGLTAYQKPTAETLSEVIMSEQDEARRIEGVIEMWVSGERRDWQEHPLILEPHELAALWHLPNKDFTAPKIAWGKSRVFVPMPADVARNQQGICLGYNGSIERGQPVYMPLANRNTHTAVIGRTGTGKSTFLHNLIHQDIAAGRGIALIDPHGTLVREIIECSIPPEREDDVVLLDFAQEEYPPPLNPLILPEGASQRDAAGRMMTMIEQIYRGFEGQMADTLYMTLLTLMQEDTPTFRDVTRLYTNPKYRFSLVDKLENPAAEDFWTTFNALSSGEQEQRRSPVEHRLRAFYGNPVLYPIMCHPKTLDVASLIRDRKIILMSLETKRIGIPPRDKRLLGAVLIANIQMAVMGHAAAKDGFALYVDEAEDFVTTSLAEMMSEARFANLSLILANQYLKQLVGDTLEAVMADVGAMVAFQCYEPDARALLPYMRPKFELEDLLNVDIYQAALWMRAGRQQVAMSLTTAPKPQQPPDHSERFERIRAKSIHNYTPMSQTDVLAWLRQRYPKAPPPPNDDEQWYDKA